MGKFERGEAEKLERDVVGILNGQNLKEVHRCAKSLATLLKRDFPGIIGAEFIGRSYEEPGDVKLRLKDGNVVYVELKLLTAGKGTRANIGQNALTEFGLFTGDAVVSWQYFRKEKGFDEKVLKLLRSYNYYDRSALAKYKGNEKVKKAMYLRDPLKPRPGEAVEKAVERNKNNQDPRVSEAARVVGEILKLAREDKLDYINYLKGLQQNRDNIKKFSILILLGIHKEDVMKSFMSLFNRLIEKLKEGSFIYRTYYVYKSSCRVEAEDLTRLITKLLRADDYRIAFPQGETNVIIEFKDPDTGCWDKLLRIVFHWKNVFQGIATPCLNIFDEGILQRPYPP